MSVRPGSPPPPRSSLLSEEGKQMAHDLIPTSLSSSSYLSVLDSCATSPSLRPIHMRSALQPICTNSMNLIQIPAPMSHTRTHMGQKSPRGGGNGLQVLPDPLRPSDWPPQEKGSVFPRHPLLPGVGVKLLGHIDALLDPT